MEAEVDVNPLLLEDLPRVSPDIEALVFADIWSGIQDFALKTGVSADQLPPQDVAIAAASPSAVIKSSEGNKLSSFLITSMPASGVSGSGVTLFFEVGRDLLPRIRSDLGCVDRK
jgi:hypothetical protein